eukprot:TRINITY_DN2925_c0_g3_i1.p1 TRINITY_DN2925_c0_g3~~TRINITY_DN2925_c0_g3_i1.p1  ORF type:complete len:614 (+),score=103.67 TRINITY_DN2925_c0_g3_i1:64-1842(+)
MDELTDIFENTDRDLLQQLLNGFKGNVQGVIEYLVMGGNDDVPSPPSTPPTRSGGKPMVGAIIEQLQLRFPTTSSELLYDVGEGSGSYQQAVEKLTAMGIYPTFEPNTPPPEPVKMEVDPVIEPIPPLPAPAAPAPAPAPAPEPVTSPIRKPTLLEALRLYYPNVDDEVLVGVSEQSRGCWTTATDQLTSFGIPYEDGIPRDLSLDDPLGGGNTFSFSTEDTDDSAYDHALATGDDLKRAYQQQETSQLMKENMNRIKRQMVAIDNTLKEQKKQRSLGAQSCRGMTRKQLSEQLSRSSVSQHSKQCFDKMLAREYEHCGTHVVFYHSYSYAALMYETQAAIARVLYGLAPGFAALPRLLKEPYLGKPHLTTLVEQFASMGQQDHDPGFRQVAISVSVSLLAPSSEAPPTSVFEQGYSCSDLSFSGIMNKLFTELGLAPAQVSRVMNDVIAVGNRWNLFTNVYSGNNNHMQNVGGMTGHMIQMFIATDVVDDLAYGSHAMGVPDPPRNPLSEYLTGKKTPDGQARVFVHPSLFLNTSKVKLYHYAADSNLHKKRIQFQDELIKALFPVLGTPSCVLRSYKGIEGKKKKKGPKW